MLKNMLLTGASALAFFGPTGGVANAQSSGGGYTIELEGSAVFIPYFAARKTDDRTSSDGDSGLGGQAGARVLRDLDERLDFAFAASGAFVPDLEHSATYFPTGLGTVVFGVGSGGSSFVSSDVNFQIIDAELGHTVRSQADAEIRLFGGLRALHFGVNTEATLNDAGTGVMASLPSVPTTTTVNVDSNFFGVGPRLGLEGSQGIFGGPLALTGGLSAAVVLGVRDTDTAVSSIVTAGGAPNPDLPTGFNPGPGDSSFEAAIVLDGDVGFEFDVSSTSSVTLGYQAQYFRNVGFNNSLFDSDIEHYLAQGVFLRWRTEFQP